LLCLTRFSSSLSALYPAHRPDAEKCMRFPFASRYCSIWEHFCFFIVVFRMQTRRWAIAQRRGGNNSGNEKYIAQFVLDISLIYNTMSEGEVPFFIWTNT
jgi:hypothetical protein